MCHIQSIIAAPTKEGVSLGGEGFPFIPNTAPPAAREGQPLRSCRMRQCVYHAVGIIKTTTAMGASGAHVTRLPVSTNPSSMIAIPSIAIAAHATNQNANSNTEIGAARISWRFDSRGSDRKKTTFAQATPTAMTTNPVVATAKPNDVVICLSHYRPSGGSGGWEAVRLMRSTCISQPRLCAKSQYGNDERENAPHEYDRAAQPELQ